MTGHRIRCFRNFVPDPVRFWIMIVISLIYLLSGAAHMASMSYQVNGLSLLQEDTIMIGYMAFIGMNVSFPMLSGYASGLPPVPYCLSLRWSSSVVM